MHAGLEALVDAGHEPHLLSYDAGDPGVRTTGPRYEHHRLGVSMGVRSLRSGPSLSKLVLDALMIARVRGLAARLGALVVAHNVEAAWVARAARLPSWVYIAHTRFDTELPTYFSTRHSTWLSRAGMWLDRGASMAVPVGAVSPALAAHFDGEFIPPAWPVIAGITAGEQRLAREALGVSGPTVLYAGNLDGYQGWPRIVDAAAGATLVVATQSSPDALTRRCAERSVDLRVVPLRTEDDRRRAYACADVALVPREAEGGLPVKLIDAMARGVVVAAEPRALAGLHIDGVRVGPLARAVTSLVDLSESERRARTEQSRHWVQTHACPRAFVEAFERVMPRY